ncbi:MAG: muconolactone Delta-isomerase family protein [Chloroflexota bacterium]
MKFLVVTKQNTSPPPEMVVPLIESTMDWTNKYSSSGKMQESWAFAGVTGGGGIVNVESLDELDAIMSEFPFAPFSSIEVFPLVDLARSLERGKQVAQAMMASMGAR